MLFLCLLIIIVWWKISHQLCLPLLSVTCFALVAFNFPSYLIVRSLIGMCYVWFLLYLYCLAFVEFCFSFNLFIFLSKLEKFSLMISSNIILLHLSFFLFWLKPQIYKFHLFIFSHRSLNLFILFFSFSVL